ncbi:MAG: ferredoxin-type protein NapF [Campylobacterota bacterium]|nr:ferredoxin-type protein NapF [Campylobacterota bacterium]
MKRRELFSSLASPFKENKEVNQESVVRPPYFIDEEYFLSKCILCETKDCKIACDEDTSIIVIQEDGTPKLDFNINGCTYCDDCAIACKEEVLKVEYRKNINTTFSIDLIKCMSWHQTMCFSCKDPCMVDAIKFLGMFKPEINMDICTSCGFCLKVCPVEAISFNIIEKEEE